MKLSLAYSPCPNDTFIFHAIANKKIDLLGLEFEVILADVEQLNQWAFKEKHDVTKLSFHAFAYLQKQYTLLKHGSALGRNCGPLLIEKKYSTFQAEEALVAIPGEYTTANFLLQFAFPTIKNKKNMIFHEIEKAVLDQEVHAGVIIHENRFTYQERGLQKIMDLGQYWEDKTSYPIPLGGIALLKKYDSKIVEKVNDIVSRSIAYAYANKQETMQYVRCYAQEMSKEVMQKHIDLYVNEFTENLGQAGEEAIDYFLRQIKF